MFILYLLIFLRYCKYPSCTTIDINMLRLLLLASAARASLYDAQQPLRGSNLDVVVPIKVSMQDLAA